MSAPLSGATTETDHEVDGFSSRRPSEPVAALLRPGACPRAAHVSTDDREHAATVVAHLLHRDCAEWSWTSHRPEAHRADARRIVGALCREGWSPGS
ncbi:MAG: hypothetical protein QOE59_2173 [Actinomycetota bacterium]|jgi:hypothetical protein|nr:hypothetical protein [Actinomycetota bacterium]